jgi:hypothetical protein
MSVSSIERLKKIRRWLSDKNKMGRKASSSVYDSVLLKEFRTKVNRKGGEQSITTEHGEHRACTEKKLKAGTI